MAHAWVQMFDTQYEAFRTYCEVYPDNAVLLVDPVSKKVCDKMDKGLISDVALKYGVSMEILDRGEIRPEYVEGKKTVIHLVKEGYQ